MALTRLNYTPANGWKDTNAFPTTPDGETEVRALLQELPDQIRVAVNGLMGQLESTTDGSSGADNVGSTTISGVTGTTIQAQLESLKGLIDALVVGEIDPASILTTGSINSTSMLADDVVTGAKIADDTINSNHYAAGSVDTEHLSAACVTAPIIDAGAVGTNHIATGAITLAKLATALVAMLPSLTTSTAITLYANLNTYLTNGTYFATSGIAASLTNSPTGNPFKMTVDYIIGDTTYIVQELKLFDGSKYKRYTATYGAVWSDWAAIHPVVYYGTSATPPTGSFPAGTIYIQHSA